MTAYHPDPGTLHANTPKMINRFTLRTRHTFLKNLFMTRKLIFLREPNLDQPMLTYLSSNVLSRFQRLLAPTSQEKAYLWWRKWRGWQKVVPINGTDVLMVSPALHIYCVSQMGISWSCIPSSYFLFTYMTMYSVNKLISGDLSHHMIMCLIINLQKVRLNSWEHVE